MWKWLLLALAAWSVPALAQFPQLPPGPAPSVADIAYAPADPVGSKGHLLDLYLPKKQEKPVPVLIFTGGSAWMSEDGKAAAPWVAAKLVPEGYAVAGVSIRPSMQAHFPAQIYDIKAAIRWLRANAERYNLDPDHIGIMGDSSGGWASAIAATTGDVPSLEGDLGTTGVSSAVQAAIAFFPPTTFVKMDHWALHNCVPGIGMRGLMNGTFCHDDADSPESRLVGCAIQSCPDKADAADPIRYISKEDPPIMIWHGESDPLVPYNQGARLYTALKKACHDSVFISLPLAGHGPSWEFLENDELHNGDTIRTTSSKGCEISRPQLVVPSWKTLIDFLDAHLK